MVVVATDSSSCLPRDLAQAWGVLVAPLQVIIDDEAFDEGTESGHGVSPESVVESLIAGRKVSTSQPGPAALLHVAEAAAASGAAASGAAASVAAGASSSLGAELQPASRIDADVKAVKARNFFMMVPSITPRRQS